MSVCQQIRASFLPLDFSDVPVEIPPPPLPHSTFVSKRVLLRKSPDLRPRNEIRRHFTCHDFLATNKFAQTFVEHVLVGGKSLFCILSIFKTYLPKKPFLLNCLIMIN